MPKLIAQDLTAKAGEKTLVSGVSFSLERGDFLAVLGPNGAGKSSLIRASLGLHPCVSGHVVLDDQDVCSLAASVRARSISYLPQSRPLAWPNTVYDIVSLGRYAHGVAMGRLGEADRRAVDAALDACDLQALASRQAHTLSGGEIARMHCARVFAAETPLLIADEPTAALDPRHQFRIMDLIARYVKRGGGALVVLHDLSLTMRYATRVLLLKDGRMVADGPPKDVLTEDLLRDVYGIQSRIEGHHIEIVGAL